MTIRTAKAEWTETLPMIRSNGPGSEAYDGLSDFCSRMGDGTGPAGRIVGRGAHAGCFSIALVLERTKAGFSVQRMYTKAKVHFEERRGEWSNHRMSSKPKHGFLALAAAALEGYARSAQEPLPARLVARRQPSEFETLRNEGENS